MEPPWDDYFDLVQLILGTSGAAFRGDGWFALLSGEQNAELNICALTPGAGVGAVNELVGVLDDDLPAVVFRSQWADPGATTLLEELGFSTAETPETLMVCERPPTEALSPFDVRRATGAERDHGIRISAEAHAVSAESIRRTLGQAPEDVVDLWLAWDGDEPISTVWLVRRRGTILVSSMMTPRRHQHRGAGRAVLTAALAATWHTDTQFAVLVATPAGRRLYESAGFAAADEVTSSFRGVDEELLNAIGQS